jgi:hypothetical protein
VDRFTKADLERLVKERDCQELKVYENDLGVLFLLYRGDHSPATSLEEAEDAIKQHVRLCEVGG